MMSLMYRGVQVRYVPRASYCHEQRQLSRTADDRHPGRGERDVSRRARR